MNISTWNSQGNPQNRPDKLDILETLYRNNDILLIQECGDLCIELTPPFVYYQNQAGAYNGRCSTCIISKHRASLSDVLYLPSSSGRSILYAQINGLNVYTLHALSGNGAPDVIHAIQIAEEPFVIGGDMNCEPIELANHCLSGTRIINIGTQTRIYKSAKIVSCGLYTHPNSRKELDFFVVSTSIRSFGTSLYSRHGGDHFPVLTTLI